MTSMARNSNRASTWAVTARLADGSTRYYAEQSARQGQQEWTPRVNQAHPFETKEAATSFVAGCEPNSNAKEYAVVSLRA